MQVRSEHESKLEKMLYVTSGVTRGSRGRAAAHGRSPKRGCKTPKFGVNIAKEVGKKEKKAQNTRVVVIDDKELGDD